MGTLRLGTFIDRYTFRYEREYPHPPERLWEALTDAKHMDAWLMPKNRIEARLGGRFHFTFGQEDDPREWSGTVAEFTPPEVVDFAYDNGGHMRFELHPIEGGTRLYFIQSFSPDFRQDDMSHKAGGDLPGGPDTPWRPGFMAGFLIGLIDLDAYVAGHGPTVKDQEEMVERTHAGGHGSDWVTLTEAYRKLVRKTIPGGVSKADQ